MIPCCCLLYHANKNGVLACSVRVKHTLQVVTNRKTRHTDCFNPFPPVDAFWRLCSRRLLKTLWQREIAQNEQFLLLQEGFQIFSVTLLSFKEIFTSFCMVVFKVVCRRFVVCGKWLNPSVNPFPHDSKWEISHFQMGDYSWWAISYFSQFCQHYSVIILS